MSLFISGTQGCASDEGVADTGQSTGGDTDTDGDTDADTDADSSPDGDTDEGLCAAPLECHSDCSRYDNAVDVSVDMNGATAPAPAIIYYDGGMGSPTPIPSGVAKIRFNAIEAQGGTGPKNGPFYSFYGSNHPAGYMVAQAWQVSRIIDLLEQNPDVIDPYHIGVTGCSRNGKGAFAAGVFDNRIALTIPCESGIGGTPALRLIEQLGGTEWPYHSISYVRWLSEVELGEFTSAPERQRFY